METENRKYGRTNPERKWLRLQRFGLAQFFVLPFAILIAAATRDAILVSLVFLGLLAGGNVCLRYGKVQRMKLRDKEDNSNG